MMSKFKARTRVVDVAPVSVPSSRCSGNSERESEKQRSSASWQNCFCLIFYKIKVFDFLTNFVRSVIKFNVWRISNSRRQFLFINKSFRGAAVAQWIRSCLPSCRPGFDSQAHHLCFFQFKFEFKL